MVKKKIVMVFIKLKTLLQCEITDKCLRERERERERERGRERTNMLNIFLVKFKYNLLKMKILNKAKNIYEFCKKSNVNRHSPVSVLSGIKIV